MPIDANDILVSYDVCSLFTNVPLDETIDIIANKDFTKDWFNKPHNLNIKKSELVDLLNAASKDQLFHLEGQLYTQMNGVAV